MFLSSMKQTTADEIRTSYTENENLGRYHFVRLSCTWVYSKEKSEGTQNSRSTKRKLVISSVE